MAKWIDGRRLRRGTLLSLACLLAAAAATALAAGCGGSSDDERAPPRRVVQVEHVARDRWTYARARFNELCAGCHTLRDAGAHGPRFNLDNDHEIDEARVRYAVAAGEPGMPPWESTLSKREYEELVAYVTAVAGRGKSNDTRWTWQMRLRTEGELWEPEDGPTAPAMRGSDIE